MAYIEELLKPFEQQALLEKIGINHDGERINRIGHSQVPVGETASVTSSVGLVTSPEGFDPSLFSKCLSQVPKELNQQRWFKILQYVSAIGSPAILRSITLAFSELHKKLTMDPEDDRIFEKLFRIHLYLERHDGRGHIDNARERYIKYCYYEAYELAVAALQEAKGRAYRERRKVSAVRMTATWKQGMRENLPSTPNSDEVDRVYSYFNPEERKVRAMDMVKLEVSRSIVREHGGNEVDIRKDITRFVKEGKVLHTVLYGARCLNPKLFILFPSQDSHRPVLQPHDLGMILGKKERQPYGRPFTLRL